MILTHVNIIKKNNLPKSVFTLNKVICSAKNVTVQEELKLPPEHNGQQICSVECSANTDKCFYGM